MDETGPRYGTAEPELTESVARPVGPAVQRHERLTWATDLYREDADPMPEEEIVNSKSDLMGPMRNAIMYSGIKEVQQLIGRGAPLIADYSLEADGQDLGAGTTLDLLMLNKRFKLAAQLLKPATESQ